MSTGLPVVEQWTLGGIVFNGAPGGDGIEYVASEVTGWSGSAPRRTAHTDRPSTAGTYKQAAFYGGRSISITGWAYAPDVYTRRQVEHKLAALANESNTLYDLTCSEETGTLTAKVELDSPIDVVLNIDEHYLDFSFQLHAQDPRKYAASASTSAALPSSSSSGLDFVTTGGLDFVTTGGLNFGTPGSNGLVSINNTGTAEMWPVITLTAVSATVTNPIITNGNTGQVLAYTGTLSPGDVLVIDSSPYSRSVKLNGSDRRAFLTTASWFTLLPGVTTSISYNATSSDSTSTMSVQWAPAFW